MQYRGLRHEPDHRTHPLLLRLLRQPVAAAAGVGALARAQGEGTDLFEALVKKGMSLETQTRKLATGKFL